MNFTKLSLVVVLILVSLSNSLAQPGGGGKPCPRPPCPPAVPLTGIEYLLCIGGMYGVKKMINRSVKKANQR